MKKQISFLIITGLIFSFLFNTNAVLAAQAVESGFNPNKLIDDKVFANTKTFSSPADIQTFLQGKGSPLANTSSSFVSMLREPVSNTDLKNTLEDPHASSTTPRTAAELIYDASKSSGLNAQVILVTLNKEQSLITGRQDAATDVMQRALDFAMGFGCPDSQPCGEIYKGFYFQLFGGVDSENNRYLGSVKSLMKSYSTPGGRGPYFNGSIAQVGDAITLPNTTGNYEDVQPQQSIVLSNSATAALYRYTPHVFNGNYNFWRFFKAWFGSPNSGSDNSAAVKDIIKLSTNSTLWILQDGGRYKLLPFVAKLQKIKTTKPEKVTTKVLNSYVSRGLYPIPDNNLIKVDGQYYIFISNKRRLITEAQIKSMGLNIRNSVIADSGDASQYEQGADFVLIDTTPPPAPTPAPTPTPGPSTPGDLSEGAVVKTATQPDVYLVTGGKLKLFTYATFVQFDAIKTLQVVSPDTLAKYPKDGLVLPKPGTLVKAFGSQTVYFYEDGQKKPMDAEIFRNRGFSFANVFELTQAVIDALPLGPFPLPVNETYFKDKKTGQLYVYRSGKKLAISAFVAGQKKITPDFTFGEDTINNLPTGIPILPKEGTVFKSDKAPDVYILNANLAFPMTAAAFTARGITVAQVNILPQAEVDSYPKGSLLTK